MGLIADEQPATYKVLEVAHGKGMQSYLCMMAVRLLEMSLVLKDTGSNPALRPDGRTKGDRPQEYLIARLKETGIT